MAMTTNRPSLNDAMQVGFEKSSLDRESDAVLFALQNKVDLAISGWNQIGGMLDAVEIAWFNGLNELTEYIGKLLATRDGCND